MREVKPSGRRLLSWSRQVRRFACHLTIVTLLLFISGCTSIRLNRQLHTLSDFGRLDKKSPFLKVHMVDGRVYVLSQWQELENERRITGQGALLDLNRDRVEQGDFAIPLDDVALFETNVIKPSAAVTGLAVVTGLSMAFTVYCALNPKACFGSCPTFYSWDGDAMALQAEGFSTSVAPALEAKDIDALFLTRPSSPLLDVLVTNEALETHVIRYARLLAAPRPESGRVFLGPGGEFWQTSGLEEPVSCFGPEGDIREKVRSFDGLERSSEADPKNLAAREVLELVFEAPEDKPCGLVLGFRQSLMTTYLFYQGLAYLGDTAGYWIAQLGRGDEKARRSMEGPGLYLGGIDVYLQDKDKDWRPAGSLMETGPIATNIQIVPLPESTASPLKVRLRLTKGLWRLDYVALAALEGKTEPVIIPPSAVVHQRVSEFRGKDGEAGTENEWPLVTMPGDVYSLAYELPDDFDRYELFIETQGYYMEWLREGWLKEKNLARARLMFTNPAKFLMKIAPEYKKVEPQMEEVFWRSRYAKTTTR